MNDMARVLTELKSKQQQVFVMATVLNVVGSAYRHEGAKMLIPREGLCKGMVSGGCLEEDLRHRAEEVFITQKPTTVTYDLTGQDDDLWGRGVGCNGKVELLLELVQWSEHWNNVHGYMAMGKSVVTIRAWEENGPSARIFWDENNGMVWDGNEVLKNTVDMKELEQWMSSKWSVKKKDGLLFECYHPRDLLYIFGAGPDAEPLVDMASRLDFDILLIDPRMDRCNPSYFPKAYLHIVEHPHVFLANHSVPHHSYVVIMTHSFKWDQEIVHYFLQRRPKYLGILGPRRRTKSLLGQLDIPHWFHSPIGLDIKAEGAEEISISIAAELVSVRNGVAHSFNQASCQSE